MKTSLMIIAAALVSGTVSAQKEIKADHSGSTTVSVQAAPKSGSVSTTHTQSTNIGSANGSAVNAQSNVKSDVNTSAATNAASNGVRRVKSSAVKGSAEASEHTQQVVTGTRTATVKTTNKVKAGTGTAAANVNQSAKVSTKKALKATRVTANNVNAAAPKPKVKVISNSALSIKR